MAEATTVAEMINRVVSEKLGAHTVDDTCKEAEEWYTRYDLAYCRYKLDPSSQLDKIKFLCSNEPDWIVFRYDINDVVERISDKRICIVIKTTPFSTPGQNGGHVKLMAVDNGEVIDEHFTNICPSSLPKKVLDVARAIIRNNESRS